MNKIFFKEDFKYFTLKYKYEFLLVFIFYAIFQWINSFLYITILLVLFIVINRINSFIVKRKNSNNVFNKYFSWKLKKIPFIVMGIYILISKILFYFYHLFLIKS
jgi:hypothetical protein